MEMCKGCKAHCCKNNTVDLTIFDIIRLLNATEGDIEKFLYIQETNENYRSFRVNGKFWQFRLKRIKNGVDNICVFLSKDGDYRCTVQDFKPGICFAYPFSIVSDKAGKHMLREDRVCPIKRLPTQTDVRNAKQDLKDELWEWQVYERMVAKWNNTGDSKKIEDFFVYATKEAEFETKKTVQTYRAIGSYVGGFLRRFLSNKK